MSWINKKFDKFFKLPRKHQILLMIGKNFGALGVGMILAHYLKASWGIIGISIAGISLLIRIPSLILYFKTK